MTLLANFFRVEVINWLERPDNLSANSGQFLAVGDYRPLPSGWGARMRLKKYMVPSWLDHSVNSRLRCFILFLCFVSYKCVKHSSLGGFPPSTTVRRVKLDSILIGHILDGPSVLTNFAARLLGRGSHPTENKKSWPWTQSGYVRLLPFVCSNFNKSAAIETIRFYL